MADFKRSDLTLIYSWTASAEHDNAKITGFPDNVLLSRHEGYEVLPFLNRYIASKGWELKTTLNKLENSLRNDLPSNTRSHVNVKNWLDINFKL